MKPVFQDDHATLYNGDCRDMSALEDGSIQCVVTSPPYWGLRKYAGVPDLVWGGDAECDHQWGEQFQRAGYRASDTFPGVKQASNAGSIGRDDPAPSAFCQCGAWRGGYGLEPTPEMYVDHTVEVLREIRRVLRDDGVVSWNLGDSYASGSTTVHKEQRDPKAMMGNSGWTKREQGTANTLSDGLKPKDLVLIPFRVALAVQADGWWVRSIIIWDKANPMPESVRDRPTTSHEYIIMLTKSARYYWDAEAVRENGTSGPSDIKKMVEGKDRIGGKHKDLVDPISKASQATHIGQKRAVGDPSGRNVRSVWSFPSQPYPDAHFATFPEALPERCIKAATPEVGCCEKCKAPWERILEVSGGAKGRSWHDHDADLEQGQRAENAAKGGHGYKRESKGWQPTCQCNAGKVPSVVLDPFAGSGTTLWVAKRLGRKSVGYELSEEYCELAVNRIRQGALDLRT